MSTAKNVNELNQKIYAALNKLIQQPMRSTPNGSKQDILTKLLQRKDRKITANETAELKQLINAIKKLDINYAEELNLISSIQNSSKRKSFFKVIRKIIADLKSDQTTLNAKIRFTLVKILSELKKQNSPELNSEIDVLLRKLYHDPSLASAIVKAKAEAEAKTSQNHSHQSQNLREKVLNCHALWLNEERKRQPIMACGESKVNFSSVRSFLLHAQEKFAILFEKFQLNAKLTAIVQNAASSANTDPQSNLANPSKPASPSYVIPDKLSKLNLPPKTEANSKKIDSPILG